MAETKSTTSDFDLNLATDDARAAKARLDAEIAAAIAVYDAGLDPFEREYRSTWPYFENAGYKKLGALQKSCRSFVRSQRYQAYGMIVAHFAYQLLRRSDVLITTGLIVHYAKKAAPIPAEAGCDAAVIASNYVASVLRPMRLTKLVYERSLEHSDPPPLPQVYTDTSPWPSATDLLEELKQVIDKHIQDIEFLSPTEEASIERVLATFDFRAPRMEITRHALKAGVSFDVTAWWKPCKAYAELETAWAGWYEEVTLRQSEKAKGIDHSAWTPEMLRQLREKARQLPQTSCHSEECRQFGMCLCSTKQV